MNRRGFFGSLARGVAAIAILPAATTYARSRWQSVALGKRVSWRVNPEWINAPYEMDFALKPDSFLPCCGPDGFPMRFVLDSNGLFVPVPHDKKALPEIV